MPRRRLRVLDFDIENRPLAYMGPDYTSGEVTAIAWAWEGEAIQVRLLGQDDPADMLGEFYAFYELSDLVTGHYIRKHDLPVINGALLEYGLPSLPPKLTCDTKLDLVKHLYISASQENLCEMLGIPAAKVHMSNAKWREANRLTPKGLEHTYKRVVGDVQQHMALRKKLLEMDALGAPKVWRP